MSSLAVDHLALPIYDVKRSLEFYERILGLNLLWALSGDDWGGAPWLMMSFGLGDERQLVLIALAGAKKEHSELPRETRHFAFSVPSEAELTSWKRKLETANVRFWEENHEAQQSVYFEDPNGIVLEITTPPSSRVAAPSGDDAHAVVQRFVADS